MIEVKTIARNISLIESRAKGYEKILLQLKPQKQEPTTIGITGAPGAGKSTIVDGLIQQMINDNKKVAVLCVDPSSPFNMGALLGDRIRMSQWYLNSNVFIRSFASRKALGGLSPMMIEITEYVKTAGFDYIIIETVGVGQNEVDVAGLADITAIVLVPEGGDDIQTMKSGIMEIADLFVVNKCDRPDADRFIKHLRAMMAPVFHQNKKEIPVIKTIAEKQEGLDKLYAAIQWQLQSGIANDKKFYLLTERAYQLIQLKRMKDVRKDELFLSIKEIFEKKKKFNLYKFIQPFTKKK